jgi:predicted RNA binding protein YcfA (HicA-like mRNA interferase family)
MKRLKVHEILTMLKEDGWYIVKQAGSIRQLRHPVKKGKVTVSGQLSITLPQELLKSIFKQAG